MMNGRPEPEYLNHPASISFRIHHSSFSKSCIISHFPCASAIFSAQRIHLYLAAQVSFTNQAEIELMLLRIAFVILAYLLGSIPFGYLLIKYVFTRGEDVRDIGSGGIG